jgi:hypothetical protein
MTIVVENSLSDVLELVGAADKPRDLIKGYMVNRIRQLI